MYSNQFFVKSSFIGSKNRTHTAFGTAAASFSLSSDRSAARRLNAMSAATVSACVEQGKRGG